VENSPLLGEVVNTAQSALLRLSQNAHCRVWSARHAEAAWSMFGPSIRDWSASKCLSGGMNSTSPRKREFILNPEERPWQGSMVECSNA
jgi:hypothetical protein